MSHGGHFDGNRFVASLPNGTGLQSTAIHRLQTIFVWCYQEAGEMSGDAA